MRRSRIIIILIIATIAACLGLYSAGCKNDSEDQGTRDIMPGTPANIRRQIELLSSYNAEDRVSAAIELGKQPERSRAAFPFLIDLLDDFSEVEWSYAKGGYEMKMRTTPSDEAAKTLAVIDVDWTISGEANEAVLEYVNVLTRDGKPWRVKKNTIRALGKLKDRRSIDILLKMFTDNNEVWEVRKHASHALEGVEDIRVINAYISTFKLKDDKIIEFALSQLIKIRDSAVEPLIYALEDDNTNVQATAAFALKRLGDVRAIGPLIKMLDNDDPDMVLVALNALEGFGRHAMKPLTVALKSKSANLRKGAARALFSLGWEPAGKSERITYLVATQKWDELVKIGKPATEPLIMMMFDKDLKVRLEASAALNKIRWKPADMMERVSYLIAAQKWDKLVRIGKPAVKPLIYSLLDTTSTIRVNTVETLGKLGDKEAVKPLVAALKDNHSIIRSASIEALTSIGGKEVVDSIISMLHDEDIEVRVTATGSLGKFKDKRAIISLISLLDDEDERIQVASKAAIKRMGSRAMDPLIAGLKDGSWVVRKASVELLGELNSSRVMKPFIAALKDKDWYVRKAAVDELDKRSWEAPDQEWYIIYLIASLRWDDLAGMGRPSVEPLIEVLKEKNSGVKKSVIWALGKIRDRRAVWPLIKTLKDNDSETKIDAIEVLGILGDRRAVEPLIDRLSDKNMYVRKKAGDTLEKITGESFGEDEKKWRDHFYLAK